MDKEEEEQQKKIRTQQLNQEKLKQEQLQKKQSFYQSTKSIFTRNEPKKRRCKFI